MDVRLVVDKGTAKRRAWQLHRKDTVVGRRHDCDLRILSAEVSRRHCLLSIQEGYVHVEDLDSINGTFINGKRVVGKQVLRPGDHLEIGPLEFVIEYELTQAALDRLEQEAAGRAADDEALEALPVSEEAANANALGVAGDDEQLDVLPLVEDDTELVPDKPNQADSQPAPTAAEEDEPLAVLEDDEASEWRLPQTNDLRDLLSQMEEPEPRPRRRGR